MYKQHLYNNILFKITFLMRKGNYPLFHIVTLKIHAFATVFYQWMYAFSTGFWTLRMKSLWVSSLQLCISLTSVKSGPHCGCSRCSHLNCCKKACLLCGCVRSWYRLTFLSAAICRSILDGTDVKLMWQCIKVSNSDSFRKAKNSVLTTYIHWEYIVRNEWTFSVTTSKVDILIRKVLLIKTYVNKEIFTMHSYLLVDPHIHITKRLFGRKAVEKQIQVLCQYTYTTNSETNKRELKHCSCYTLCSPHFKILSESSDNTW